MKYDLPVSGSFYLVRNIYISFHTVVVLNETQQKANRYSEKTPKYLLAFNKVASRTKSSEDLRP